MEPIVTGPVYTLDQLLVSQYYIQVAKPLFIRKMGLHLIFIMTSGNISVLNFHVVGFDVIP